MSKRTKEEIQREIETAKTKLHYLSDQEKILLRQEKQFDRKARTRRLIERGAILEKYLNQPLILSNDQVVEILNEAFSLTGTKEILERLIRETRQRISDDADGDDIA